MTPPLTAPSTGNKHRPRCLCSRDWGCSAALDVWAHGEGTWKATSTSTSTGTGEFPGTPQPLGSGLQGAGGDDPRAGGTQPAPFMQLVEELGLGDRG